MTWYKKSKIAKAFSALSKPYELEYKTTVMKIQYYAKAIDNASASAARAELRDLHVKIDSLTRDFKEILQVTSSKYMHFGSTVKIVDRNQVPMR